MPEKIDYMFHGGIRMDKTVKLLVQVQLVFVVTDLKSISLIM